MGGQHGRMSFQLDAEPLPDGIRRVVLEQVDGARKQLTGATDDPADVAIHEARKRFKRVRAVLRLLRDELGERVFACENAAYRDVGRRLAGLRDAKVLVDTVDALDLDAAGGIRAALVERAAATAGLAGEAVGQAVTELDAARTRVASWPLRRDEFAMLESGLARVYRQGRVRRVKAYADPNAEPGSEQFHDWRKRVKDLWHAFQLLENTWPPVLSVLAEQAHDLSDLLGDDHDIGVLVAVSAEHRLGTAAERKALAGQAERRGARLRAEARLLGARLYAEEPWDFTDRLGAYHRTWRAYAS